MRPGRQFSRALFIAQLLIGGAAHAINFSDPLALRDAVTPFLLECATGRPVGQPRN